MTTYPGLVAALSALCAGGCFFVQPINSEPQARIDKLTPGPHHRGDTIELSAAKSSDPNDRRLTADWRAFTCNVERTACDAPAFESMAGAAIDQPFALMVPARRTGVDEVTAVVLVTVTIRDTSGAEHEDRMYLEIFNQDPALDVQVQGFLSPSGSGYPIGTSMRVVAAGSDPDSDALSYAWRLYPAGGSVPENVRWDRIDDTTYELEPDVTGLWRVEVTALDGVGGSIVVTESILVQDDMPPCIASTDPRAVEGGRYIVDRDSAPRRFAVLSVRDDLDVYPPPLPEQAPMGSALLRWQVATPDTDNALVVVDGHEAADYVVDASAYAPGDRLSIRVEIDDRVGRAIVCGEEQPTCSLGGDACLQRVTWEVEVR